MLKNILLLIITLFFVLSSSAYTSKTIKKIDENQVIFSIDNENFTYGKIKKAFEKTSMNKNINFENVSRDSIISFLDLYINYKLKVKDGKTKGIDKDSTIVKEIKENQLLLSESYLFNKEIVEPAINYFENLRKTDKKIALIMTTFDINGDTSNAYKQITAAAKELQNGAQFDFTARKYSVDTSTSKYGGILPLYITGLKIQKKLEDAIVKLKVGEYTKEPVKTDFGYFLIKLIDEQPREIISLSHILISFQTDEEKFLGKEVKKEDSLNAKKLIDSLYILIKNGADFAEIANKFSSDKPSLAEGRGGSLGIYSRSTGLATTGDHLVKEVEEAAYKLKDKEFTIPIISKFGYHIIKRDTTINYPKEAEREEIKNTYRRLYYAQDEEKYLDSIAITLCNYSLNSKNYKLLLKYVDKDKTTLDTNFVKLIPEDIKKLDLYSINGKTYKIQEFINNITTSPELKVIATNKDGFEKAIKKINRPIIINKMSKEFIKKYPELEIMFQDFQDGIISFKMEEINVWEKNKVLDTVLARKFYDTTTMDLQLPKYYDISEIYMLSYDGLTQIRNEILSNKLTFDSAAIIYTQRNGYRDKKGHHGSLNSEKYALAEKAENLNLKIGDISEPFKYETGYSIIKLNNILPARKKTFEEAIPDIAAKVQIISQKNIEKNWIESLKNQYKVTINTKAINSIFNKK